MSFSNGGGWFTGKQQRNWNLFNGPQRDPTQRFKKSGTPYFRRGHDRVLMPDDFMPVGHHASKHLRAVPKDYLLWVDQQPWSKDWIAWRPVSDFIARFITPDHETSGRIEIPTGPLFYVDQLRKHPTNIKCFEAGSAHLHCLPGHEDLLHAFVVGGLELNRRWYQNNKLPHYDVTVRKHAQALSMGAELIDDHQLIAHKDTWLEFFQSKPKRA